MASPVEPGRTVGGPDQRGQFSTPIRPQEGSFFNADPHPALSATERPKTCYADRPIVSAGQLPSQAFARNEALLLLNQLAYQLLHIARTAMEAARGEGVSLHWLRRAVLVIGTRVVTGSRQLKVIIENRFADLWAAVISRLYRWRWTPP